MVKTSRDLITEKEWLNCNTINLLEDEVTEATTIKRVAKIKSDREWIAYWSEMLGDETETTITGKAVEVQSDEAESYEESGWNMNSKERYRRSRKTRRKIKKRVVKINIPRYLREKELLENGRWDKKPISLYRKRGNEKNEFPTKPVITRQQNKFLEEIDEAINERNEEKERVVAAIIATVLILEDLINLYKSI